MGRSMKRVFLICPVRNASEDQIAEMNSYIYKLEQKGYEVFYPTRDNKYEDTDNIGVRICTTNCDAIRRCDEVHIFFDPESRGTLFDIGAAFALRKPVVIANESALSKTPNKSFVNVILHWPHEDTTPNMEWSDMVANAFRK